MAEPSGPDLGVLERALSRRAGVGTAGGFDKRPSTHAFDNKQVLPHMVEDALHTDVTSSSSEAMASVLYFANSSNYSNNNNNNSNNNNSTNNGSTKVNLYFHETHSTLRTYCLCSLRVRSTATAPRGGAKPKKKRIMRDMPAKRKTLCYRVP